MSSRTAPRADSTTTGVEQHLTEMAHGLFGKTAAIVDVAVGPDGAPSAFTVTFDAPATSVLADPQRRRHAEWRLGDFLDPSGTNPALCVWDLPHSTVTVTSGHLRDGDSGTVADTDGRA
ncbi:hypothetical protein ACWDTP_04635 [Mycobacterium sp. NPDC003449]